MRYVGLDVHWRQSTICVLDHRGQKLLNRTIKGPRKIALVATAHYLLRAMMAMLRTGEVWRSSEEAAT